ncbi:hypothetical protein [Streptomyces sp. NPDC018833]|uniref:hypothetical protein n=1 Tax=Streptomyces sp. NPDC018833 TaxID=3365053 RepID=UPI0037A84694
MSRFAEVLVLAPYMDEVMEPLTRKNDGSDPGRTWSGAFTPVRLDWGGPLLGHVWAAEFERVRNRTGLLKHLESLPWPYPEFLQVMIRDQDDECFGLWMLRDGRLVEISLPRTRRFHQPAPPTDEYPPDPGLLLRTDTGRPLPEQTPPERRDPRPAW